MKSGKTVEEGGRLNNFAIEPPMYASEEAKPGFTPKAERLNGRLAMLGFVGLLLLEAFSGTGIVGFLGHL